MKFTLLLLVLACPALLVSCGNRGGPVTDGQTAANKAPEFPKDGIYRSKGKVTKVDKELGSIELDHEDIPGLMPPMIMEFFIKDKVLLEGIEVGDTVDFDIEYKHPSETVVRIEKLK